MAAFEGTVTNKPLNFGGLGMTGGRRYRLSTLDFVDLYPTGGEPVNIADFDFPVIIEALVLVGITSDRDNAALNLVFDLEHSTIICTAVDDGLECDNTTDLSGLSAKFLAIGY
jgi:hypothetical protein